MFESIRFIAAGAEKLSSDVRVLLNKNSALISMKVTAPRRPQPAVSCNIPDVLNTAYWHMQIGHKPGTVGMPLPGSTFKIVDPESFEELPIGEAGLILVGGTQVMKGYLKDAKKN